MNRRAAFKQWSLNPSALIMGILVVGVLSASGGQFLLYDAVCTLPATGANAWPGGLGLWKWTAKPGIPTNWLTPVNYRDGKIYLRAEVISKTGTNGVVTKFKPWPSARIGYCHIGFSSGSMTKAGDISTTSTLILNGAPDECPSDWRTKWDWTKGSTTGYIAFKGISGKTVERVTAFLVSKDATFQPPVGWTQFGKLNLGATFVESTRPRADQHRSDFANSKIRAGSVYTVRGQKIAGNMQSSTNLRQLVVVVRENKTCYRTIR